MTKLALPDPHPLAPALPGCVVNRQSLQIFSPEGFHRAGLLLASFDDSSQWIWGDYLIYAEKYGLKTVLDNARMDLHRSTIFAHMEVSRFFSAKDRHPDLSFTHHRDVVYHLGVEAKLSDAKKWLARAAKGEWTCGKLREELRQSMQMSKDDPGPLRGHVTLADFDRLSRSVREIDPEQIPTDQRAAIQKSTKPLWDFLCRIHRGSFQT